MKRKWNLATVDIGLVDEAEMNANRMTKEAFERLVGNIRVSGGLSSAIACYRRDGRYVIISGHHRYRACVRLRHKEIPVIYADEADMSRDEIIALQLSHNSLHGEDNRGILKRMFDEIRSVDFKEFAHIDVNEIADIDVDGTSFAVESEHFTISLILYKSDYEALQELLELTREERERNDMVILADGERTEEEYLDIKRELYSKFDIKSTNISFGRILSLAKERMAQLDLEDENRNTKGNKGED